MSELSEHQIITPSADDFFWATQKIDGKFGANKVPGELMDFGAELGNDTLAPFGRLALRINPVNREIGRRRYEHLSLIRALGFGAGAGLLLARYTRESSLTDEDIARFWHMEGMTMTEIGRRTRTIAQSLGAPTQEWLQRNGNTIIPESKEARWFSAAAGLVLDLVNDGRLSQPEN